MHVSTARYPGYTSLKDGVCVALRPLREECTQHLTKPNETDELSETLAQMEARPPKRLLKTLHRDMYAAFSNQSTTNRNATRAPARTASQSCKPRHKTANAAPAMEGGGGWAKERTECHAVPLAELRPLTTS